jgi:hypothetical protein
MGHSRRFRDVRAAAALPPTAAIMLQCRETTRCANTDHSRMQSGLTGFGRKRTGRFGAADQESGRRRCAARMNACGNSQSRALAIHPPVRTALTPAVGSDFAKVLSKLPPEELERCSELPYNQRARPVPRQQRAAALGSTFASVRSREHGLPHQGHGLHPSLSHQWTVAQFLGAPARVTSGGPRSAYPSRRGDDALVVIN